MCGFFWFICLELLGRGAGVLRWFRVWEFVCFGWLSWFCFFCMLLQKHVYEMNVRREMHFQSHDRIKCF